MKQFFKRLFHHIKVGLAIPVYYIDRWLYLHVVEHNGLYLKIHKSLAQDLQEELDIALKRRKNRKDCGEHQSIFYYSLDWEW